MASLYAEINHIRNEAATVDPVKVALTVLSFPFVALFFLLRFVWMIPAFMWAAGQWGWQRADSVIKARESAARGSRNG